MCEVEVLALELVVVLNRVFRWDRLRGEDHPDLYRAVCDRGLSSVSDVGVIVACVL